MTGQGRGIYQAAVVLLDEGSVQLCCNEGWMGGQSLQKGLVSGQPTHLKGRQFQLNRKTCLSPIERTWVSIRPSSSLCCVNVQYPSLSYTCCTLFSMSYTLDFSVYTRLATEKNTLG